MIRWVLTAQAGLGKLDERALETSGGGAQSLLNAQASAKTNKIGVWSVEPSAAERQARQRKRRSS